MLLLVRHCRVELSIELRLTGAIVSISVGCLWLRCVFIGCLVLVWFIESGKLVVSWCCRLIVGVASALMVVHK